MSSHPCLLVLVYAPCRSRNSGSAAPTLDAQPVESRSMAACNPCRRNPNPGTGFAPHVESSNIKTVSRLAG